MSRKNFAFGLARLVLLLVLGISSLWPTGSQSQETRTGAQQTTAEVRGAPGPELNLESGTGILPVSRSTGGTPVPPLQASQTVRELRAAIQNVLRRPVLAPAIYGIKVVSLDTGQILFEENAAKLLRPASNLKLYTWAAALDKLSPDFRFRTSVYVATPPDSMGTVHGDLTIYGRGDPSFAARFNNGDYSKAIDVLASKIATAGVKSVDGDLVGDDTFFSGPPFEPGWEWNDLQWWYGAEISALTINDNSVDLFVKPGSTVGAPCKVSLGPPTPLVTIVNHSTSSRAASGSSITVHRDLRQNVIEIGGSMAIDSEGYSGSVAISHPAEIFVAMLRSSLARLGINVTGRSRAIEKIEPSTLSLQTEPRIEIATIESPPLAVIAARTLKASQNLYSELVLRTIGKASGEKPGATDDEAGIEVVRNFLGQAGVSSPTLTITDGSGLSRNDLVTANSTLQLLVFMSRHRYASTFRDALPIAGVDGTLKNRMKKTLAVGNVRAKTGTLASGAALSGYVTSARGERLVFSIIINNFPEESETEIRRNVIDAIAVLLADFSGHS